MLAVTDAAVLARQVDGVLLVADAGRTKEHALAAAAAELQKTGGNVLGVALNRLDVRRGYNYYYYYYYSEEEGGEKKRVKHRRTEGHDCGCRGRSRLRRRDARIRDRTIETVRAEFAAASSSS